MVDQDLVFMVEEAAIEFGRPAREAVQLHAQGRLRKCDTLRFQVGGCETEPLVVAEMYRTKGRLGTQPHGHGKALFLVREWLVHILFQVEHAEVDVAQPGQFRGRRPHRDEQHGDRPSRAIEQRRQFEERCPDAAASRQSGPFLRNDADTLVERIDDKVLFRGKMQIFFSFFIESSLSRI